MNELVYIKSQWGDENIGYLIEKYHLHPRGILAKPLLLIKQGSWYHKGGSWVLNENQFLPLRDYLWE